VSTDLLLREFDRVAIEPDAIAHLRRFVIDLAVRGMLTEQAVADGTAGPLRDALASFRNKSDGPGLAPLPSKEALPFEIPTSWQWVRLGDAFAYDAGDKVAAQHLKPHRWLLDLEDIESDTGKLVARVAVTDRDSLSTKSEFEPGDVLYGKLRPYLNKAVVAYEGGYSTTEIVAIRSLIPMCPEYTCLALRRPDFVAYVTRLGQGTKMPRLRREDALSAPFPLPPLEEQRRIVAKVQELMALCDQLEAVQKERELHRDALRAVALHRLATTADEGDTAKDVKFFLKTSERLIAKPEHVGSLRRTILDLSVRGQLTCSNRDRWIKYSLGEICTKITDGTHRTPTYVARGIPFISVKDFSAGRLSFTSTRFIPESEHAQLIQRCKPERGDILIGRIGTLGKPVLVDTDREFSLFVSVGLLKPRTEIVTSDYLRLLLDSPTATVEYDRIKIGGGTHTNKLNLGDLKALSFAIPSVPEQLRIVAKVDQLMMVCEELETALACTQSGRTRLLDSLLSGALAEASRRTPFPRDFSRPTETASLTTTLRGA